MHEVLSLSLDASQSALTRYSLAAHVPDVLITVPKDACRTADFHKAAELIDLGRDLACQALGQAHLETREPSGDTGPPSRGPDKAEAVDHLGDVAGRDDPGEVPVAEYQRAPVGALGEARQQVGHRILRGGRGDVSERAGDVREPGAVALAGRHVLDAVEGDQPGHSVPVRGDREALMTRAEQVVAEELADRHRPGQG